MLWISQKFYLCVIFACINGNFATDNDERVINNNNNNHPVESQRIQSRMLEVFTHQPPSKTFENVNLLKNKLIKRDNLLINSKLGESGNPKSLIDVNTYEIVRHKKFDFKNKNAFKRLKREIKNEKSSTGSTSSSSSSSNSEDKPVSEKLISTLTETEYNEKQGNTDLILPMPEAVRGPIYSTYPIKEFDTVDMDDPDYLKRRKNDTSDIRDDSQRDKRTFGEGGSNYDESTTPTSFWKKKKENPSFVTGRGSSTKNNDYTPPQHRTGENRKSVIVII